MRPYERSRVLDSIPCHSWVVSTRSPKPCLRVVVMTPGSPTGCLARQSRALGFTGFAFRVLEFRVQGLGV